MTQRIPSSSYFTCPWSYNVFLSFRGMDTRWGFTGHLYNALCRKGIETFMDDKELPIGGEITPTLVKAIEKSRIAIIIFSENYASSAFCLEELVKILELMKQKNCFVWPVFYKVNPSDVRHQRGIFGEAFNELVEKRFKNNMNKVQKWKLALNEAANLSGWDIKEGYKYEHEFISHIVDEVSRKTTHIPLQVANYPVGLESRIKKVKELLETKSSGGVNMVGIYGIGGIGKTTIASAVYNLIAHHFEGVCFLNDIRENSITKHDLAQLQKKLLVDILQESDIKLGSVKEGNTLIKYKLQKKKVLLILDDVDKLEQLQALAGGHDWFGFGSKIIITTRDAHLLDAHCVERRYEVAILNYFEALKLFRWNAFKKEEVDPNFLVMSDVAISYCNGLPLALEVIASNLCKRSIDAWESALKEYRRILDRSIYEKLKVSYDCLEEYQQKIFLDLACFFRGASLEYAVNIFLNCRDLDPKYGIEELVDKSLIMIDERNHIRMHNLIQEMGREIIRRESPSLPGKRSRLWSSKEIIRILEENMGSDSIEVMMLNLPGDTIVQWDGNAFEKMKNLQVLVIKSANFSTEINQLPKSLRLFEWVGYPFSALPPNFSPRNLVTLGLPDSCFKLDRPLNDFKSLRYLNLSGNKVLTQIPDISGAPNLIDLRLTGCLNLTKVDKSVCIHSKIRVLDAKGCIKLSIFPHGIMMESLESLDLSLCSSLKIFPEISGKMENLRGVDLNDSGIEDIPFSIQNLVGLVHIWLKGCSGLSRLPSSILTLPKLKHLSVSNSRKFYFYCKSKEQEEERVIPLLHSNKRIIFLIDCNLRDDFLPTRLPCLSDWEVLRLNCCNFTILPASIKEFSFLERLELIKCKKLREIRKLPSSLKKLVMCECRELQEIRELPPNIKEVIAWNCTSLTSKSLIILLNESEVRDKLIVLPGGRIPKRFNCCSKGPSLSFWFRKKIPSISIGVILSLYLVRNLEIDLILNGTQRNSFCRPIWATPHEEQLFTPHIVLYDLETELTQFEANRWIVKHGWNHVEISYSKQKEQYAKWIGVYIYKQENMEDLSFETPNPPPKR